MMYPEITIPNLRIEKNTQRSIGVGYMPLTVMMQKSQQEFYQFQICIAPLNCL